MIFFSGKLNNVEINWLQSSHCSSLRQTLLRIGNGKTLTDQLVPWICSNYRSLQVETILPRQKVPEIELAIYCPQSLGGTEWLSRRRLFLKLSIQSHLFQSFPKIPKFKTVPKTISICSIPLSLIYMLEIEV